MTRCLRILHLNDQHGWRGGEQQTLTLMIGLRARGHEVLLAAQPGSVLADRARGAGIDVVEIATRGEVPPGAIRRLRRTNATWRPHLVHCHTSHSHMHGLLACVGNRTVKLIVSRRVDFSIHKAPLRLALWKYRTRVDRYIAISQAVRRVLVQDGVEGERIGVVLSGLDPARAERTAPADLACEFALAPDSPAIVTVAALVGHKGHRFLVDAVPEILRAHPGARFIFVGAGPLEDALRRQARERGVADAILFAGFRDDFLAIAAAADVYVMPSHLEGLNTSVIDAMFFARPIVVTDAGGLPELVQDGVTGRVVPKENPPALAHAIVDVLHDAVGSAARGAAARAWALQHVTADCMVEGTLREYDGVLEPKK